MIFHKNLNLVTCQKMGGGQGSGPSHPDDVGRLCLILYALANCAQGTVKTTKNVPDFFIN